MHLYVAALRLVEAERLQKFFWEKAYLTTFKKPFLAGCH